jgi:hypothetical protein
MIMLLDLSYSFTILMKRGFSPDDVQYFSFISAQTSIIEG